MSTITSLFDQAQLAEAAYANLASAIGDQAALQQALDVANKPVFGGSFPLAQATGFAQHWKVVDHVPDLLSGFSATIFESLDHPGQYTLAIRGSLEAVDFIADAALIVNDGIAVQQLVDLYNFWQRATTPRGTTYTAARLTTSLSFFPNPIQIAGVTYGIEFVDSSRLSAPDLRVATGSVNPLTATVAASGHSLGGHLAMAFTRLFPSWGAQAVAINGLGFKLDNPTVNNLFTALGGASSFDAGLIQNVYGTAGLEFAAMNNLILQQPDGYDGVFIESASPLPPIYGGHGAGQMTDSLALYALFAKLDPRLNTAADGLSKITAILQASANIAANSLEAVLAALGKIYGKTYSAIETDRNDFYTHLYDLQAALGTGTVVSLATTSRDTLVTEAKRPDATGLAYRYALKELNPFAVVGADYSSFNASGELDLYDPATGSGTLSELYLQDRAAFLAWKNVANTQDLAAGVAVQASKSLGQNWEFRDEARNTTLQVQGSYWGALSTPAKILFGSDQDDVGLTGGDNADHLYGGAGNDVLSGGKGSDYLEGQLGDDTLKGEDGRDVLIGGAGNDTLLDQYSHGRIECDGHALTGGNQSGERLFVRRFQNGHLGVQLNNLAVPPVASTLTVAGDLNPIEYGPPSRGYHYDALGNVETDGSAHPGVEDRLYGGSSNDKLYGSTGHGCLGERGDDSNYIEGHWVSGEPKGSVEIRDEWRAAA